MNDLIRLLLTWMETGICSILHFQPSVSDLDRPILDRSESPGMADLRRSRGKVWDNLDWAKSYFLDKILISFGKDIRHKSSDSWGKVKQRSFYFNWGQTPHLDLMKGEIDFLIWDATKETFLNATRQNGLKMLSFQIKKQLDQDAPSKMPTFETLFDIIGDDLRYL